MLWYGAKEKVGLRRDDLTSGKGWSLGVKERDLECWASEKKIIFGGVEVGLGSSGELEEAIDGFQKVGGVQPSSVNHGRFGKWQGSSH